MAAQLCGFFNGSCMIGTKHRGSGLAADFCIPASPAARIQDSFPVEVTERETCLRFKRGAVLGIVSDIKTGPLMAKTFQMFVGDKSRNSINDSP